MSWGAQNRPKDAKIPNVGPAMSEKRVFYQLFNKSTPPPARPSDLKLADWKPGINLLSVGGVFGCASVPWVPTSGRPKRCAPRRTSSSFYRPCAVGRFCCCSEDALLPAPGPCLHHHIAVDRAMASGFRQWAYQPRSAEGGGASRWLLLDPGCGWYAVWGIKKCARPAPYVGRVFCL
jgi:hypothetical protein